VLRISNDYLLDARVYNNFSKLQSYFLTMGMKLSYCLLCQNDYQLTIVKRKFPHKRAIKISNPIFIKDYSFDTDTSFRKYIAWIGLYQYQKNVGLLYDIARLLKDEQFYIAGKEGTNYDEDTKAQLEKLRELPNVKFVGFLFRNDVLPFLSKAKYLLNTSHYEGFSNTFLEAMSVGTPIISNLKVNPDSIITNFNLGIVYEDASGLVKQITEIDPNVYKEMSNNAKDYVSNYHDYKKQAKKLISFLNSN
jgi:glycosyltransferase involved in cell wall biosynthesis